MRGRAGQITGKTISVLVERLSATMSEAECDHPFLHDGNLVDAGRRKDASPKLQFLTFAETQQVQQSGYFDRQRLVQGRFDRERKLMAGTSCSDGAPGMAVQARHFVTLFASRARRRTALMLPSFAPAPERIPGSDLIRAARGIRSLTGWNTQCPLCTIKATIASYTRSDSLVP